MKTPEELAAQLAELERLLASCDETDERKRSTLRRAIAKHHRIIIECTFGGSSQRGDEVQAVDLEALSAPLLEADEGIGD